MLVQFAISDKVLFKFSSYIIYKYIHCALYDYNSVSYKYILYDNNNYKVKKIRKNRIIL